jgi:hypothetical protein
MIMKFVSRGMDIGDAVGFCGFIALRRLTGVNLTPYLLLRLRLNVVAKRCVTSYTISEWFIMCKIINQSTGRELSVNGIRTFELPCFASQKIE